MATRTISNAGGNYNATGTWVEGAVPTSADDVVATATSGQLTVNVASAAQSFNFTNYTNTLTVNQPWTISGASSTSTFVSAMTITGTNNIIFNSAHSIRTNGRTIPRISFGVGGGTKTLLDELRVTSVFSNSTNMIVNGATLSIAGNTGITFTGNMQSGSTTTVVFNPTQNTTLNLSPNGNHCVPIVIDADATITLTGGNFGFLSTTTRIPGFRYIRGTFSTPPGLYFEAGASSTSATFSISGGNLLLDYVYVASSLHTGARLVFNLDNDVRFKDLSLNQLRGSVGQTNQGIFRFTSTGRLIGGAIIASLNTVTLTDAQVYSVTPKIELSSGPTHSIEEMYIFGNAPDLQGTRRLFEVSSFTSSTISYLAITGTHSIVSASFSDIDASLGNPVKVLRSNLRNTTNITNFSDIGGVSGGSFTFVN